MRQASLVIAALLLGPAQAQDLAPVSIELVLALDSSASVDRREFNLQLEGLALAFRDPEVQRAVDNLRPLGAAIAVVQWGGPGETRVVLPFTHLESARDSKAFGFRIALIYRWMRASSTSIATAIDDSRMLIANNEFDGFRKIIDVSGDGRNNTLVDLEASREAAQREGITINGLPITGDDPDLNQYFIDNVIAGHDAFTEPAADFEDFKRAIREKLLRELRPLDS